MLQSSWSNNNNKSTTFLKSVYALTPFIRSQMILIIINNMVTAQSRLLFSNYNNIFFLSTDFSMWCTPKISHAIQSRRGSLSSAFCAGRFRLSSACAQLQAGGAPSTLKNASSNAHSTQLLTKPTRSLLLPPAISSRVPLSACATPALAAWSTAPDRRPHEEACTANKKPDASLSG